MLFRSRAAQAAAPTVRVAWAAVGGSSLLGGVVAAAYLTWVVRVSGLVDWWPAMPSVFLVMVTVQGLAAYWLLLRPAARGVA